MMVGDLILALCRTAGVRTLTRNNGTVTGQVGGFVVELKSGRIFETPESVPEGVPLDIDKPELTAMMKAFRGEKRSLGKCDPYTMRDRLRERGINVNHKTPIPVLRSMLAWEIAKEKAVKA